MWIDSNGWLRVCVIDVILVQNNYCAKPNPDTDAHYGYRVCNELEYQASRSTLEYDVIIVRSIRPLTQPVMYKIGSSIFAATTQIKLDGTTSAYLPIIASTESIKYIYLFQFKFDAKNSSENIRGEDISKNVYYYFISDNSYQYGATTSDQIRTATKQF